MASNLDHSSDYELHGKLDQCFIFHCLTLLRTQFLGESNHLHLQVGCRDGRNSLLHLLETHSLCSALGQASLFSLMTLLLLILYLKLCPRTVTALKITVLTTMVCSCYQWYIMILHCKMHHHAMSKICTSSHPLYRQLSEILL